MPNWIFNELTISGPAEEIKRFKDGLLKVGDEFRLLQSYVPCPRKLIETEASWQEIGYETFFNPDPAGYSKFLEYPYIKKLGIETRTQLMEYVKRELPDSYENGVKINNNLFEFGYRNWYDWCNANWSTKWDAWDVELNEVSPTELIFKFISAFNPPLKAFDQIVTLFPYLDFYQVFYEGLGDFNGFFHWFNGEWVDGEWVIGGVFEDNFEEEEFGDDSTTFEDIECGISVFGKVDQ